MRALSCTLGLFLGANVLGEVAYPAFERLPYEGERLSLADIVEKARNEVNEIVAQQMGKPPTESVGSDPSFGHWLRENHIWLEKQTRVFAKPLTEQTWPMVTAEGRMPMPSVLANSGSGIAAGIDAVWSVHSLCTDAQSALEIVRYGWFWSSLVDNDSAFAISWLLNKVNSTAPTTADVVELQAMIGYWPGQRLNTLVAKKEWEKLHSSANPIHRFIALEKFDSTEQSPSELLALYRECLFGACSYLEVRALEAITRNQDFREEVATLLEEYIASNPPTDDGTLPKLRSNFPDLIEGARSVIEMIRSHVKEGLYENHPVPSSASGIGYPENEPKEAAGQTDAEELADASSPIIPWVVGALIVVLTVGLRMARRDT